jgi:hypothetical protein
MAGEGYDLRSLAFELSSKIGNGFLFNVANIPTTTNSTSYTRVGGGIITMDCFRKSKITSIDFYVASGLLGTSGLDVQLYDVTNLAEIVLVNFLGTEDNTIKFEDANPYLTNISGSIEVEVNIRKAGPIGPSTFDVATLNFKGVI